MRRDFHQMSQRWGDTMRMGRPVTFKTRCRGTGHYFGNNRGFFKMRNEWGARMIAEELAGCMEFYTASKK